MGMQIEEQMAPLPLGGSSHMLGTWLGQRSSPSPPWPAAGGAQTKPQPCEMHGGCIIHEDWTEGLGNHLFHL